MTLTSAQVKSYSADGFLVIEGFVEDSAVEILRSQAEKLVRDFDASELVSIFSTHEQSRVADEYFLTSGDKIRFFFEENAFNPDGTLKYKKEKSINKIGHALHDLDPAFRKFSRSENVKQLAAAIGFADSLLLQSMYIFKQPN